MSPTELRQELRAIPSIVVVGSLNIDLVVRMSRAPVAGETVSGIDFSMLLGGKGANQAVACARMGASVTMVGRVGDDTNGELLRAGLSSDGIDVREVKSIAGAHTGIASIWIEADGQNRIVLTPGANGLLDRDHVAISAASIDRASMLILQLEVPIAAVQAAIDIAFAVQVPVLLNPSPALSLPGSIWAKVAVVIVNESEAAAYAGIEVVDPDSAVRAGELLRARGPRSVIVTLGSQGVVVVDDQSARHMTAKKVDVVDTTAAGDTFTGTLAVALCEGQTLDDAVALGQAAAALCVTRRGAQSSIPYRRELSQ